MARNMVLFDQTSTNLVGIGLDNIDNKIKAGQHMTKLYHNKFR